MAGINEIRKWFVDYFLENDHHVLPSSPLVPKGDPTLIFNNAGMVPFKNIFTGSEKAVYPRVVSAQKCVRAGGKHNDLDNVGYTARHHTFFEMLGNFSFGDYFKDEAIYLAWNLLTDVFGLSRERLVITVHTDDHESAAIWRKVAGYSDNEILRIGNSDNFWAMGAVGPCGPCSEIFYDHGDSIKGGLPGSADEGDRYVEIWNLVFMQFYQKNEHERVPLPQPSIDTGMGLERIAAVLQGKHDNYDIDVMQKIINGYARMMGCDPHCSANRIHFRVIADHIRAIVFLIADGVMPSNVGRGYVLRRIMRRAMRHAHALGQNDFLLWRLVRIVVEEMHQGYPELDQAVLLAEDVLRAEEKRFQSMLDRGLFLLKEEIERGTGKILPGDVAFKLYDTYGFPLDLTQDILSEHGLMVDLAGFDLCMEEQKRKARESWVGCGKNSEDGLWLEIKDRHGCTEFVGYNHLQIDAMVQEIVSCESCGVLSSAKSGDEVYIVVNQTPFYGESGGQVGDTGTFSSGGATGRICDVKKRAGAGVFIHKIIVESGELHSGDYVTLIVDSERRWLLSCNHTATHILHRALRDVLGESVAQRGSLVSADKIRFDFSFHRQLSDDEKFRVDSIVNELIRCNQKVSTSIMSLEEARSLGACALFGEKYANEVRTVFIGKDDGTCRDGMGGSQTEMKMIGDAYSIELCGGTHVSRTGDLAVFKIISESASSSGVRRVEALIGERALSYLNCQDSALKHLAGVLRVGKEDIAPRIECLIAEKKEIETKLEEIRRQLALNSVNGNCEKEEDEYSIGGYMLLFHVFKGLSQKELMGALDGCRRSIESGVVVMASLISEKILLVVGVSEDLVDYVSAVDIVRLASEVLGGRGGGGRPDFAQAGGVDVEKMNDAKEAVKQFFSDLVETRLPSLTS